MLLGKVSVTHTQRWTESYEAGEHTMRQTSCIDSLMEGERLCPAPSCCDFFTIGDLGEMGER